MSTNNKLVHNSIQSPIEQLPSSPLEQIQSLHSSTLSSHRSITPTLCKPQARRADGTELIVISSSSSSSIQLPQMSTHVLPWNHCSFPRALSSRGKVKTTTVSKRQLPSLPMGQSIEVKSMSSEQFDKNQLYQLLDNLEQTDELSSSTSTKDFTKMLDQLTMSPVLNHSIDYEMSMDNLSSIDYEKVNHVDETVLPDFFDHPLPSAQEKQFYTTLTISVNDLRHLSLYTMTFSTVQLSSSICLPYSILNGRRPSLKSSKQTHFKPIRSKRPNYNCQITAIDTSVNHHQLKQNDIILKVN